MDGFFYVNKKSNMTSYDVIRVVKKQFNVKKIGHTGTLDPLASGLLVLCVGKATKLAQEITDFDKTYEAEISFGNNYDTYDVLGEVIDYIKPPVVIDADKLLTDFTKSYYQEPPMYSAIKSCGKKLYELARENITIERDKRLVHIYDLKLIKPYLNNTITIEAHVSKGTYIRSLAYDMGKYLNTYGAISKLIRTKIGKISLLDATDIDELEISDFIKLEDYLKNFPKLVLNDYLVKLVKNGVYLDERQTKMDSNFVVYNTNDEMIAYYEKIDDYNYKPILIL